MKKKPLKNFKVLITAGPTWVAVDPVRVLSNVSSGRMGSALVRSAARYCVDIDLLLGPVTGSPACPSVNVIRFSYFEELDALLKKLLKKKAYDLILHAAAVSDYRMKKRSGKISSSAKTLVLKLSKAPKLISKIRRLNPKAYLVMFKLEPGVGPGVLIKRAARAQKTTGADLVVANQVDSASYRGFIVDQKKVSGSFYSRQRLADRLFEVISLRAKHRAFARGRESRNALEKKYPINTPR